MQIPKVVGDRISGTWSKMHIYETSLIYLCEILIIYVILFLVKDKNHFLQASLSMHQDQREI